MKRKYFKIAMLACTIAIPILAYLDDHDILSDKSLLGYESILLFFAIVCSIIIYAHDK